MVFFYEKMKVKDILYLVEKDFVSTVYHLNGKESIYSVKTTLNKIAKQHLFNLQEYYKLVRREIGLKNKIPIYFSEGMLLFNLKCKQTSYFINFFNVLKVCFEDDVIIIFKNNTILHLEVSKKILFQEMTKINKVLDYVRKL